MNVALQEIVSHLGMVPAGQDDFRLKHGDCPVCGKAENGSNPGFSASSKGGFCHHTNTGIGLKKLATQLGIEQSTGNRNVAEIYAKATCDETDRGLILRYLSTRGLKPSPEQAGLLWVAGLKVWRWKGKGGVQNTEILYPIREPTSSTTPKIGRVIVDPVTARKLAKKTMGKITGDCAFVFDPHPEVDPTEKGAVVLEGLEDALTAWLNDPEQPRAYIVASSWTGISKCAGFLPSFKSAVVLCDPDPADSTEGTPMPSLRGALLLRDEVPSVKILIPRLGDKNDANRAHQEGRFAEWRKSVSPPTPEEIKLARGGAGNVVPLRAAQSGETPEPRAVKAVLPDAPVADDVVVPLDWSVSPNGVSQFINRKGQDGTELHLESVTRSPLLITARIKDVATGDVKWRLTWQADGQWTEAVTERETAQDARQIVRLAQKGAPINSPNARKVISYLADFEAANVQALLQEKVSSRLGWLPGDGFLWGDRLIGGKGETRFHGADAGDDQIVAALRAEGSLADWQAGIEDATAFPVVMATLYASLSAPLLKFIGCPNYIVDLSYTTSSGKTTALRVAGSVWGCPDERLPETVVHPWNTTRVFRERAAALLCNLPLILDDTKTVRQPKEIADTLYDFAQGHGRGRGSQAGMRVSGHWQTVLLSSGEMPATHFTQDGGTRARVLTLWGPPFGDGDNALAVHRLDAKARANYGHAGPRFVAWLTDNRERWPEFKTRFRQLQSEFIEQSEGKPVGGRLAAYAAAISITGELAHEVGVCPWKWIDPMASLWGKILEEGQEADRAGEALRLVLGWAKSRQSDFFGRHEADRDGHPKKPMMGWAGKWEKGSNGVFGFFRHVLDKLLKDANYDSGPLIRLWHERGFLDTTENRSRKKVKIDGEAAWLVCFNTEKLRKFEGSEEAEE